MILGRTDFDLIEDEEERPTPSERKQEFKKAD